MKKLFAVLLLVISGHVMAASAALKPPAGITGNPAASTGWTTASNFAGQFSAASFNANFTTNVGGRAVTMPASMRLAANAPSFAAAAVRLNPAGLVGGAIAAWLLTQGLEWANNQWTKQETPEDGWLWSADIGSTYHATRQSACKAAFWRCSPYTCTTCQESAANGVNYYSMRDAQGNNRVSGTFNKKSPTGAVVVPATEADFAQLATAPLTDAAATEFAQKGVALPLESPVFDPKHVDVPLSDPYVDPVTGKRYRDQARVTPQSDGKTADVQTTKQEVDESGDPIKQEDGQTDVPPEKETDFCKQNPDAASCKELDEAPDTELEEKTNPFSLNPVSGFGADNASCPAPQQLFTRGGQQITWDWGKFCTFAQGIRPLIIGFAWLSAIMIVVAVGRRNA